MNKSRSLTHLFRIALCLCCLCTAVLDAYAQDVYVDNTVTDVGGGIYRWTVFLVAPRHQLDRIKYVDYCLQDRPSYPNPRRRVANRKTRFALSEFGYEEFDIRVNIFFNDGTFRTIDYGLNLIDRSVPHSESEYASRINLARGAARYDPIVDVNQDGVDLFPGGSLVEIPVFPGPLARD